MEERQMLAFLWGLLDDIDTLDDACKENDKAFRDATRKRQRRRFETGINTDGYLVFLPNGEVLHDPTD